MFFDADHGKRLTDALDDMVAKSADLVFLEGFTDMAAVSYTHLDVSKRQVHYILSSIS